MLNPHKAQYKWQFERSNNQRFRSRRHPNDETVPMDVDPPIFTQVNRAYTEEDKKKHRAEGRCFHCSRIGHMARECPMRKTSASQFRPTYQSSKPQSSKQQNWRTTTRKFNQPRKRTFGKSTKFGQPSQSYARTASIEEVDSDQEDEIHTSAARVSQFDEQQREQWVQEMKSLGINF
jgi:hypothetical protein